MEKWGCDYLSLHSTSSLYPLTIIRFVISPHLKHNHTEVLASIDKINSSCNPLLGSDNAPVPHHIIRPSGSDSPCSNKSQSTELIILVVSSRLFIPLKIVSNYPN